MASHGGRSRAAWLAPCSCHAGSPSWVARVECSGAEHTQEIPWWERGAHAVQLLASARSAPRPPALRQRASAVPAQTRSANGQPAGAARPPAVRSLRFRSAAPDASVDEHLSDQGCFELEVSACQRRLVANPGRLVRKPRRPLPRPLALLAPSAVARPRCSRDRAPSSAQSPRARRRDGHGHPFGAHSRDRLRPASVVPRPGLGRRLASL